MNLRTLSCLCAPLALAAPAKSADTPNVLFIAVDDLKPLLGCYGDPLAKTPNLDRLARQGTLFANAHCQQAVCGPSRASLLTGKRPDRIRVWDLKTKIRATNPGIVTLPEHFRRNGYETVALGKIFDPRSVDGQAKHDAKSWSIPYTPSWQLPYNQTTGTPVTHYQSARVRALAKAAADQGIAGYAELQAYLEQNKAWAATECEDVPDDAYDDGAFAAKGVELIRTLSVGEKPFFIAVGFKKPHLPFAAPKKYWDLYQREAIPLAEFREQAAGAPALAYHDGNELRSYSGIPAQGPLPDELQRELIHGYYACASYIDTQVGKLLEALDRAGVADRTVVVLWGDHGWHLGDHGLWAKHTNLEQATRSPLLIATPGRPGGGVARTPVELLDLFPTLTDLCGLPMPQDLDGRSLAPVLQNPDAQVKEVAASQFPRGARTTGYALRDEHCRYVAWLPMRGEDPPTDLSGLIAEEYYDYRVDPLETRNLVNEPARRTEVDRMRARLAAQLTPHHENTP